MTNPKHTDTSRIADLRFQVSEKMPINHSDLSCLFDRIEALEAENERLIKAGDGDAGLIHWQGERIEQLEAALTKSEALQDLAYYNGAKQYAAISAQSEDAARDWLNGGCGNRQRDAIVALGDAK